MHRRGWGIRVEFHSQRHEFHSMPIRQAYCVRSTCIFRNYGRSHHLYELIFFRPFLCGYCSVVRAEGSCVPTLLD